MVFVFVVSKNAKEEGWDVSSSIGLESFPAIVIDRMLTRYNLFSGRVWSEGRNVKLPVNLERSIAPSRSLPVLSSMTELI